MAGGGGTESSAGSESEPAGGADSAGGTGTESAGAGGSAASTEPDSVTEPGPLSVSVPVHDFQDVLHEAGVPHQETRSYRLPAELEQATVDLEASLPELRISPLNPDGDETEPTLEVTLKVAEGGDEQAACDEAEAGTATVTGDEQFTPQTVDPQTLDLGVEAINAANSGEVSICIETTTSVDALVSLDALMVALQLSPDCDDPEDLSGTWEGTYTCDDICGDDSGGDVTLTIFQQGQSAAYMDDEAFYFGVICGGTFTFSGGSESYDENGVFTLTGADTAMKESSYSNLYDDCGGDCMDQLTRQ